MPNLTIEYSPGLESRADLSMLCQQLHDAMVGAGIFPLAGIRIRAHRADHCIVADGLPENDFAALTLAVGAGRSREALQKAGEAIFVAAQSALVEPLSTPHFALSLEIRVIDPVLSWKDTPIHARLAGQN
ncbi:5-carboxymethyl-2-hydroxymuconate Delta-isomerase [Aliiruegeria lutimaris]|uniref:5-carboxymethyl-2-hydroxymuconate isomerase n=1 Tax=Aliiruegeria lutimaris TaxID=571298 RepID=A0A1G9A875_9RHOB|nr:5-carboxymethyl-2-hydroxymuconate Delta-isomerase [Aliiruegeria lutimaris]SDK23582.1 5-carboxymethyl-2-hydroxymuconate isomerase [Aliiruegeria lutimaris]